MILRSFLLYCIGWLIELRLAFVNEWSTIGIFFIFWQFFLLFIWIWWNFLWHWKTSFNFIGLLQIILRIFGMIDGRSISGISNIKWLWHNLNLFVVDYLSTWSLWWLLHFFSFLIAKIFVKRLIHHCIDTFFDLDMLFFTVWP